MFHSVHIEVKTSSWNWFSPTFRWVLELNLRMPGFQQETLTSCGSLIVIGPHNHGMKMRLQAARGGVTIEARVCVSN